MKDIQPKHSPSLRMMLTFVVLCLACVMLAGCVQGSAAQTPSPSKDPQDTPVSFVDDLGNEVVVKSSDRVIACMGSFANTWELAGGTLIGATEDSFTSYEISSPDVAKVGDFTAPNLEEIIALNPDFVIMTGASSGRDGAASQTDLKQTLEASGITVAYFNVTTFDEYLRMLRTCCDITGRDDLFEKNGSEIAQQIEDIKVSAAGKKASRVLLMTTYSGGTRVQNSSTLPGNILADLGGSNLADEHKSLLKDFSLESVIELDPDFIFVVPMGNDDAAVLKNLAEVTDANPAWATLSAVKGGRYITLDKEHFLYKPNQNWAESYQMMFDYLYA